jgi:hypothetical protein
VAIDVVIDPANGQIYWNDNQTTAQSIAISGNATDKINFIGYSGAFAGTAGTAPADPVTRVTINDSVSSTLVPGSNGYELGTSSLRWNVSATSLDASGKISLSYSPVTGVNNNHTLQITSVPFAEVTGAVIELGAATAFDGTTANFFSGSANGTYLAIRSASTFTGDYLNFGKQDSTSTTFSVSSNGNVTVKTSNQYGFVVNDNANGNKFVVDTNNTRIGIGKPADYPLDVRHTTANTSTVASVIDIETLSSGTTAAGFGGGLLFSNKNAAGATVLSNQIEGILSEVGASYKGSISFRTNSSGTNTLNERIRVNYNSLLLYPYESTGTYELRFNAFTGATYVGFKAPDNIASSVMWTLPAIQGTNGQFLKVGTSGVLSWDTIAAGTGTVTSVVAGTGLTGGTITTTGTIAIDTTVVPTLTATNNSFTSGNIIGSATSSAFSLTANSLTTGTGAYFASNSVTSGRLVDIVLSGNTGSGTRYGLSIAVSGANTAGTTSYGLFSNVTATVTATNIAAGLFSSGGTNNVPLRLGLNTNQYTNFFINADGTGITLSPTANGAPFFSLAGYAATVPEFRLCSAGGGTGNTYVGFKAPLSLAASKIWELPGADGSNGQVLTWTTGGVLTWSTVSGSASPAGTNNGDIQYKTGSSFAASTTLNYDNAIGQLSVSSFPISNTSATSAALKLLGTSQSWSGVTQGTFLGINAATGFVGNLLDIKVAGSQKLQLNYNGELKIANAYTLPTTTPAEGQVLTYNGTYLVWAAGGTGTGTGTVNSGAAGKIAYYPSLGTAVDDASALVYATTGTNLTVTASAIGVIPLAATGITGQTSAIFKAILDTTDVFVISNTGNISTGTWNASVIGIGYGGTGQTTYTDGQLLIGNSSGNTLTKSTLTAGSGVSITNGNGSITIRQKRPLYLTFCAGFTPSASGVDSVVLRIPNSPADGTTGLTYNVREFFIRVEAPSSGTSSVQVEYYNGTGVFTATNMMTSALSITGASTYESSTTTFSQATLSSGNKVRLNFTVLDGTHTNFFIQLLLEEN